MTNKMYDRFLDFESTEYDFFYAKPQFEKMAATRVSRSSSQWEIDILKKLSEEKPFVLEGTDYLIKFKEVDGERGYAFGSVIISNVQEAVRTDNNAEYNSSSAAINGAAPSMQDTANHVFIPITIKDFKLDDFDIFVHQGQPRALTDQNFARHMSNQNVFASGVRTSGDNPNYDEIGAKNAPPGYAARQGLFRSTGFQAYASAGMSKIAGCGHSAASGSILEQVLPTISADHRDRFREHVGEKAMLAPFAASPTLRIIDKIVKGDSPTAEDKVVIFKDGLPRNVVRIERTDQDAYTVTATSNTIYEPRPKTMNLVELLDMFSSKVPKIGEVLAGLGIGKEVVLTIDHEVRPLIMLEDYTANPKLLTESGPAFGVTQSGDIIKGHLLNEVYEPTGKKGTPSLFFSGDSWAYQDGIVGEMTSHEEDLEEGSLSRGVWGTFVYPMTNLETSEKQIAALVPFKIISVSTEDERVMIKGVDVYSCDVHYIITPGVQNIVNLTENRAMEVGGWMGANAFALPRWYKFIGLGHRITMESKPHIAEQHLNQKIIYRPTTSFGKKAPGNVPQPKEHAARGEAGGRHTITIKRSAEGFVMEGPSISAITHDDNSTWVSGAKALYYLILLGANTEMAQNILDSTRARGISTISNCRNLKEGEAKLASITKMHAEIEEAVALMNKDLVKEAAELAGEDSVDNILSLSFINPENLTTYLQNMERMENTENDLAQLLLLVRLGLNNVNESAVVNALRNLAEVNEDLRFVNFLIENRKIVTN